jgi:hypothetical protein
MNSIEFQKGYLFGRLHSFRECNYFEDFISEANEIISYGKIPLDIKLLEQICDEWSSSLGVAKYEGKEYVVMDCIDYAVYIDEEKKQIKINDDEDLIEILKNLDKDEEEQFEYIVKTWDRNGEYTGLYEGADWKNCWTDVADARVAFDSAIETEEFSAVELVRIDPNANEDRETIIDDWEDELKEEVEEDL